MAPQASLRLFCSHGAALFYIAQHPDCVAADLADALVVTRRTVWTLISDLKRADLIKIRREGRTHHYRIKEEVPFPDPLLSHLRVGQVFQALVA